MTDGIYDIVCTQGATLSRMLTLTNDADAPLDLTGFHAKLQVRKTASAAAKLLEIGDEMPLTGITINGPLGKIAVAVDESVTAGMPPGTWVYDLMLVDLADNVVPLLQGRFVVQPGVTR